MEGRVPMTGAWSDADVYVREGGKERYALLWRVSSTLFVCH